MYFITVEAEACDVKLHAFSVLTLATDLGAKDWERCYAGGEPRQAEVTCL